MYYACLQTTLKSAQYDANILTISFFIYIFQTYPTSSKANIHLGQTSWLLILDELYNYVFVALRSMLENF